MKSSFSGTYSHTLQGGGKGGVRCRIANCDCLRLRLRFLAWLSGTDAMRRIWAFRASASSPVAPSAGLVTGPAALRLREDEERDARPPDDAGALFRNEGPRAAGRAGRRWPRAGAGAPAVGAWGPAICGSPALPRGPRLLVPTPPLVDAPAAIDSALQPTRGCVRGSKCNARAGGNFAGVRRHQAPEALLKTLHVGVIELVRARCVVPAPRGNAVARLAP